jgi:hypothetical protein
VSCAHVVFASACVFDFGVCVCVVCADDNAKTIATSGGIEAAARAMTIHADNNGVQKQAVMVIHNVLRLKIPARIATAKAAGVVPLLQRAKGQCVQYASEALGSMGV